MGLLERELYTPSDITGNVRSEDLIVMLDEMGILQSWNKAVRLTPDSVRHRLDRMPVK